MKSNDDEEPTKLYKYCSVANESRLEWLRAALQENKIYYSSIDQFNDPFEGHVTIAYDATREEKECKAKEIILREQPKLSEQEVLRLAPTRIAEAEQNGKRRLLETIRKNTGVYCLSKNRDDILMWSHYADSHHGVCIEFSVTEASHFDFVGTALRVVYQNLRPCLTLYRSSREEIAKAFILTKSQHWSYEDEWRITDLGNPPGDRFIPPRLISGMILGARITDESRKKIEQFLDAVPWPVTLYHARISSEKYGLDICSE